jgi:homopolymeric O-antigen transport system permease protein
MTTYAEIWRYRELFGNLWRRDLQSKYKGSALGVFWVLIPPFVLTGVYLLVFHYLWRATQIPHYTLYLLAGIASWVFFSTTIQGGSRAMLQAAPLIRKTPFPRQLTAFAVVGTNLVTYAVMLAIVLVACFIVIPEARAKEWLALPLAVLLVGMGTGLALALACANVVYRDVEHLVASLLLPWFFLTPIIYSFSQFHHHTLTQILRYVNPITPPIEAIRAPLLGSWPNVWDVVYLCVACIVSLAIGAWVFNRVDDRIAVEL